ncbi:MAG: response regulator transcription factor [Gemmatimonadota bacterium]|nr:MAG: response regulator transcription factor [Gemmatimonadota bacterium]
MKQHEPTVFIVDDDAAVRDALGLLLRSIHLSCELYPSANAFLEAYDADRPGCLVLDVRMPGMSGLELQQELERLHSTLPIIFLTAHGDVPMAVTAVKAGAADFLEKPFRDQDLIDKIQHAIAADTSIRRKLEDRRQILARIQSLTPREREVMDKVVDGSPNKVIAMDLGLSQRTVEIHRTRVMRKMQASSLSQLVQIVMSVR